MQKISYVFLLAALALSACEVGPDYTPPQTALPANWISADDPDGAIKAEVDQQWWDNFNDPVLTQLIDKAAAGNADIQIDQARIAEARASENAAFADLLPSGDVKGEATREANQLGLPPGAAGNFGNVLHKPFNIFQTGFDASWELDLFGGHRRADEAAVAQLQASEATRDDMQVSIMAEVARTYVTIRRAQMQLAVAQDTVDADQKTVDIAQQLFAVGQSPRLDVTQAEAALEQDRTQIATLTNAIGQAEYSMDVLLGEQPGATHKIVGPTGAIPASNKKLVLAAPAAVIAQRPDIRIAERRLAAATAQQGVAVAKFFPDISLSGFFGAFNTSVNNLVSPANESWMTSGSVVWPILSYGTLSANLQNADAQQKEALLTYQKSILAALSDVEQALTAYTQQEKFLQSTTEEVTRDQRARATAQERYRAGQTSLQAVLDADRALYAAQTRLIQAKGDDTQGLIAVYKSLGGGWVRGQ